MGNPVKAATSETTTVSELVKQITTDEAGNYVFPADMQLTDEIKFAATAEKRRRDTQAEFTKVNQAKIALEAENSKLKEVLLKQQIVFTPEQVEELEDLKLEDPEKWRQKLNEYEKLVIEGRTTTINEISNTVKTEAEQNYLVSNRQSTLLEFNKLHGINLTEQLLLDEVPNRITRKLVENKVSYEDYLDECLKYLLTNKAIKEEPVMGDPNLNRVSGGREPGKIDIEPSLRESYKKDLY